MLYSIPGNSTTNEASIQGQGALTAADIALASSLIPSWNDLNAGLVPTIHPGSPWQSVPEGGVYRLKNPISPAASAVPKVAIGLAGVHTIGDPYIWVYSQVDAVTTSNIDVTIGTWDESRLLSGALSTFWTTAQSANPVFQTGYYPSKDPTINQRIKFEIPYKTRPKVLLVYLQLTRKRVMTSMLQL